MKAKTGSRNKRIKELSIGHTEWSDMTFGKAMCCIKLHSTDWTDWKLKHFSNLPPLNYFTLYRFITYYCFSRICIQICLAYLSKTQFKWTAATQSQKLQVMQNPFPDLPRSDVPYSRLNSNNFEHHTLEIFKNTIKVHINQIPQVNSAMTIAELSCTEIALTSLVLKIYKLRMEKQEWYKIKC